MVRLLLSALVFLSFCTFAAAQDISEGLVHHITFSDRDNPGLDAVTGVSVMGGSTAWYPEEDRYGIFPAARVLDRAGYLSALRNRFVREVHEDFALSYWMRVFRFTDATKPVYLFDNRSNATGSGLFARYLPADQIVEYGEEGAIQTTALALDTVAWVHIAFVEDQTGGMRSLYLDGEALPLAGASYRAVTGTFTDHPEFRVLGTNKAPFTSYGAIRIVDDVRLHNRAITAATVAAMYAEHDSLPPAPTRGPVTFNPPFPDGLVQTRWSEAEDDHSVREYIITLNDSTWATSSPAAFFNYRYEDGKTYALSLRSVDYFGNSGTSTYDTTFVWGTPSSLAEPTWSSTLAVTPNPAAIGGALQLYGLPAGVVRIELLNVAGQRLSRLQVTADELVLPASLYPGVYVLRFRDETGRSVARSLMIQ